MLKLIDIGHCQSVVEGLNLELLSMLFVLEVKGFRPIKLKIDVVKWNTTFFRFILVSAFIELVGQETFQNLDRNQTFHPEIFEFCMVYSKVGRNHKAEWDVVDLI
jgi:hypothetical protein